MWVGIEATEMEVGGVTEALAVRIATGTVLQPPGAGVEPFGSRVGCSLNHPIPSPLREVTAY